MLKMGVRVPREEVVAPITKCRMVEARKVTNNINACSAISIWTMRFVERGEPAIAKINPIIARHSVASFRHCRAPFFKLHPRHAAVVFAGFFASDGFIEPEMPVSCNVSDSRHINCLKKMNKVYGR